MSEWRLIFRVHAVRRMFERGIDELDVRQVLEDGEVIENRPDDVPHPSRLILGRIRDRPIHVVASDAPDGATMVIITVYEPDPAKWSADFRERRP